MGRNSDHVLLCFANTGRIGRLINFLLLIQPSVWLHGGVKIGREAHEAQEGKYIEQIGFQMAT